MNTRLSEAAKAIHSLSSVSTRCYKGRQLYAINSRFDLPDQFRDIFLPYWDEIRTINAPIGCITTPNKYFFGFVRYSDESLVIGPVTETPRTFSEISAVADRLDPDRLCHESLLEILQSCPLMSIYSFMPILASTLSLLRFNARANDTGTNDTGTNPDLPTSIIDISFPDPETDGVVNRLQSMESFFESIIERGDVKAMQDWFRQNQLFHLRINFTEDPLRNARACFIMCSSFYARAANRGGLDRNYTLQLQTNAIRAMEELDNENDILMLQSDLALEFTREVAAFNSSSAATKIVRDAVRIIQRDLHSTLRVEDIASALSVSRGHLSRVFHDEIGQTISEFITQKKIDEAKRLLISTSQSLTFISDLLKFSSQSHFTKVFKQRTGMTPKQYRNETLR